jgi:hypothetical protein
MVSFQRDSWINEAGRFSIEMIGNKKRLWDSVDPLHSLFLKNRHVPSGT